MILESLNDALQNCEENKRANFTLDNLLGCACLLQEGEEGRPCAFRDLNRGNRRYHTCSGVADKIAKKIKIKNIKNNSSDNSKIK